MSDRPKHLNDVQKRVVAGKIAEQLITYSDFTEEDREGIIDDLMNHAVRHQDGYELAKKLDDRCGWTPDSSIVEVLDGWSSLYSESVERTEKEWFAANPIAQPMPIGARVTFGWQSEIGVIDGIYEHGPGKFLIKVEGDKHGPTSRRIVNFEDVKAESPAKAAP